MLRTQEGEIGNVPKNPLLVHLSPPRCPGRLVSRHTLGVGAQVRLYFNRAIAKLLDAPALDWDDAIDTKAQVIHWLSQFHTRIEVLVLGIKRTEPTPDQYQSLVNTLGDTDDKCQDFSRDRAQS